MLLRTRPDRAFAMCRARDASVTAASAPPPHASGAHAAAAFPWRSTASTGLHDETAPPAAASRMATSTSSYAVTYTSHGHEGGTPRRTDWLGRGTRSGCAAGWTRECCGTRGRRRRSGEVTERRELAAGWLCVNVRRACWSSEVVEKSGNPATELINSLVNNTRGPDSNDHDDQLRPTVARRPTWTG